MHVLFIANSYPNPEQPDRGKYTQQIVKALQHHISVSVISPLPWCPPLPFLKKLNSWYLYSKVPVYEEFDNKIIHYPKYLVIPKLFGAMQALTLSLRLLSLVKQLNQSKKIDVINAHYLYPDGVAAVWVAKQLKIPIVVSARGSDVNVYENYTWRRFQLSWALKNSHAYTGVSRILCKKLVSLGAHTDRLRYIPNGIDPDNFAPVDKAVAKLKLGLKINDRFLLFTGWLKPVKGLNYLIDALRLLDIKKRLKFHVLIVGDGPERLKLENKIKEYTLENKVRILGVIPHHEIPLWMGAADVFCLPSTSEGMPNVVLEALSCGVPVVATNVGALPDIINDNNGCLVSPRDVNSLAEAIDATFSKTWDHGKVQSTIKSMTWTETARQYLKLYEDILSKYDK